MAGRAPTWDSRVAKGAEAGRMRGPGSPGPSQAVQEASFFPQKGKMKGPKLIIWPFSGLSSVVVFFFFSFLSQLFKK